MKHFIIIMSFVVYWSCSCQNSKQNQVDMPEIKVFLRDNTEEKVAESLKLYCDIPEKVINYMNRNLKGYSFVEKKGDLSDYEKDYFTNNPQSTPFGVHSDFNGDGKEDYALILIDGNSKLSLIAIITKGDSYEYQKIKLSFYDKYENRIELSCDIAPKGTHLAIGGEGSEDEELIFENNGIDISYWDASRTFSYYIIKDKFERVLFD